MVLPKPATKTRTVILSGGDVEIRILTWDEVRSFEDGRANAQSIAYATGCTEEEAAAWMADEGVPSGDVSKLLSAIAQMSGLGEEAQFRD